MPRLLPRLAATLLGLVLAGCAEESPPPLFGRPTPIPEGAGPMDVVCAIQREFAALPRPVMESTSYRSRWTRRPLGAAPTTHRGFHRVHLRPEAIAFLEGHARIEVVASLAPLLTHPDLGGEAAAVLAGIPAGDDATQGAATRALAGTLHDSSYRSPSQPGRWQRTAVGAAELTAMLYGPFNATSRVHARYVPEHRGSLEEAILAVLKGYATLTRRPVAELWEALPVPPLSGTIAEWHPAQPPPRPAAPVRTFLETHPRDFAAVVLLPSVPLARPTLDSPDAVMMQVLGIEDRYWAGLVRRASGNELVQPMKAAFRHEVLGRLLEVCGDR